MRRTECENPRRTQAASLASRRAVSLAAMLRSIWADALPAALLAGAATLAGLALPPAAALAQAPGPESFAVEPRTPLELWGAVDYLVRTGQAAKARPYLQKFLAAEPDDSVWLDIRDRYSEASILRLQDAPELRKQAEPLLNRLIQAEQRAVTNPARLAAAIGVLERSPEERAFAQLRLREAGPYAVPALVEALSAPGLADSTRQSLVDALGSLDDRAVPPLVSAALAAIPQAEAVAGALGRIGDPRALTSLVALASNPGAPAEARRAARDAVERLSRVPFDPRPGAARDLLARQARNYQLGRVKFPGAQVTYWTAGAGGIKPVTAPRREAERFFAASYADAARAIAPDDAEIRALTAALAIDDAIERQGLSRFPGAEPSDRVKAALTSGPDTLTRVLNQAIADKAYPLAAAAAKALGEAIGPDDLASVDGRTPHPLVRALSAPDPRVQFAAARALVTLNPSKSFLGAGKLVPTLAYFAGTRPEPYAVVIDGNVGRAGQLGGMLETIGYQTLVATNGAEGFRLAASSAGVELVFIDPNLVQGAWRLTDTLANLRADARTANLPTFVVGQLGLADRVSQAINEYPGTQFLVMPASPTTLSRLLGRMMADRPRAPLTGADRAAYSLEATELLARLGEGRGGPFRADLTQATAALIRGLHVSANTEAAARGLSNLPTVEAQRSLANAVLDPSRSGERRVTLAGALASSFDRFGLLIDAEQAVRLVRARDEASDPALSEALGPVVEYLKPRRVADGRRASSSPTAHP